MVGFFFFIQKTVQNFTNHAHFKIIAVLFNGGSVRTQIPLPEFTVSCTNLETKFIEKKDSGKKIISSNFQ